MNLMDDDFCECMSKFFARFGIKKTPDELRERLDYLNGGILLDVNRTSKPANEDDTSPEPNTKA